MGSTGRTGRNFNYAANFIHQLQRQLPAFPLDGALGLYSSVPIISFGSETCSEFFFFFFNLAESFFYRKWPRAKIREAFGTLVSSVSSLIIKYDTGEMCSVICDAFVTSRTVAHQAPGSTGSSRQEHWSGLPCPPPGDLPDAGIESTSLCLLLWQMDSLPLAPPAKPNKGEKGSEVAQSCPTLCDPMDCRPPGSSVHGIFQARVLEWVAISFSRRSS